jgi:hypothetical protein
VLVEDRLDGTGPIFLAADLEAHAPHPVGMRALRCGDIAGIGDRAFAGEELDYLIARAAGAPETRATLSLSRMSFSPLSLC